MRGRTEQVYLSDAAIFLYLSATFKERLKSINRTLNGSCPTKKNRTINYHYKYALYPVG